MVSRTVNADGSTVFNLKQSWFLADGSTPDDRTWTIPMAFATSDTPKVQRGSNKHGEKSVKFEDDMTVPRHTIESRKFKANTCAF